MQEHFHWPQIIARAQYQEYQTMQIHVGILNIALKNYLEDMHDINTKIISIFKHNGKLDLLTT